MFIRIVILFSTVLLVSLPARVWAESPKQSVKSADVLVAVGRIISDLELVREALGRPEPTEVRFKVKYAEPRHVYFHTQTIFRKMNALAGEIAEVDRLVPRPAPDKGITSADVLGLIKQVQGQLEIIKLELGIRDVVAARPRNKKASSVDVMQSLISANQRTSQLLKQNFQPKDVYRQLNRSSNYVAGVLAKFAGAVPYPALTELNAEAQPPQVFATIAECIGLNQQIGKKTKIKGLIMDNAQVADASAHSAGQSKLNAQMRAANLTVNYEAATLLLADVGYWSWRLDATEIDPSAVDHGSISTPIVLQKAQQLKQQLRALLEML